MVTTEATGPTPAPHPYVAQVTELWRGFYGPPPVDGPPDPGMAVDRSTRKAMVLERCTGALPATTRVYCGLVPDAMDAYLGSEHWHGRRAQEGSLFPEAASTVTTFAAFLEEAWLPTADPWARQIARYECDVLWGAAAGPTAAALRAGVRLPEGAWVAGCVFDVPEYAVRLREACASYPWPDAVRHTRPRARPFATLTLRTPTGLRRTHLRDAVCEALRPLWDEEAGPVDTDGKAVTAALGRGLVVPCVR
ncbi:hypothetical protein ACQEVX_03185 [Streptomyces syringium]|uniref:hypothetical protein n=1 Tax=Streptomyces syringium TaxID=76729 RepID=UPI003D8A2031